MLLVLAGDVETNPGPTGRRSSAMGPTTEEQVYTLNTQVRGVSCTLQISLVVDFVKTVKCLFLRLPSCKPNAVFCKPE